MRTGGVPLWRQIREDQLVRPKIKLEKVENFQRSNKHHLRTTIHHTITTNPPANHHQKTHEISRPPLKNARKIAKNRNLVPQIFLSNSNPKKPLPAKSKIKTI
jgi:spore germination protein YaaH